MNDEEKIIDKKPIDIKTWGKRLRDLDITHAFFCKQNGINLRLFRSWLYGQNISLRDANRIETLIRIAEQNLEASRGTL